MSRNSLAPFLDTLKVCKRKTHARAVLSRLENRMLIIRLVGWPALEQSLARELDQCRAIAKARGLL